MPTKGLFGFRRNGTEKLTYNHRESYPQGLGRKVVDFCRNLSVQELNNLFDELIIVDDEDPITAEQIQAYKNYLAAEHWSENLDWKTVLRYNNDPTLPLMDGFRVMVEYGSFIGSQRCRWVYIINLDDNQLEIYKNGLELLGRKTDDPVPRELFPPDQGPLLTGIFPLDNIPENWLECLSL